MKLDELVQGFGNHVVRGRARIVAKQIELGPRFTVQLKILQPSATPEEYEVTLLAKVKGAEIDYILISHSFSLFGSGQPLNFGVSHASLTLPETHLPDCRESMVQATDAAVAVGDEVVLFYVLSLPSEIAPAFEEMLA